MPRLFVLSYCFSCSLFGCRISRCRLSCFSCFRLSHLRFRGGSLLFNRSIRNLKNAVNSGNNLTLNTAMQIDITGIQVALGSFLIKRFGKCNVVQSNCNSNIRIRRQLTNSHLCIYIIRSNKHQVLNFGSTLNRYWGCSYLFAYFFTAYCWDTITY